MGRKLLLTRIPGTLGGPVDALVIDNAKSFGEWKADSDAFEAPIGKGEHAIQIEIHGADGKRYRSNVLFTNGKKDIVAAVQMSGIKITLLPKKD